MELVPQMLETLNIELEDRSCCDYSPRRRAGLPEPRRSRKGTEGSLVSAPARPPVPGPLTLELPPEHSDPAGRSSAERPWHLGRKLSRWHEASVRTRRGQQREGPRSNRGGVEGAGSGHAGRRAQDSISKPCSPGMHLGPTENTK